MSQVELLHQKTSGAQETNIVTAMGAWQRGGSTLSQLAIVLESAAASIREGLGLEAGQAAHDAFIQVSERTRRRSEEMVEASNALAKAQSALTYATSVRDQLGPEPTAPSAPPSDFGQDEESALRAQHQYDSQMGSYHAQMAQREEKARVANERIRTDYAPAIEVMRQIHGDPVEPPKKKIPVDGGPGSNGSTGTGGGHTGTGTGGVLTHHDGGTDHTTHHHGHDDGGNGGDDSTTTSTTDDQTTQVVGPTLSTTSTGAVEVTVGSGLSLPGLGSGAAAAGVGVGAMAGSAAMFGGRVPSLTSLVGGTPGSTSAAAVRPIGSTARAVTGGALGRSGATPTNTAGRPGSAASGGRSSASSAGSRAGARAGARSGASAGSRRRGKDDERDDDGFMSTEDDWTDDEGSEAVLS